MTVQLRTLAEELFAAWNDHALDAALRLYHPDYSGRDVATGTTQSGPDEVRAWLESYWTAFPDMTFTLLETVEQDDRIALHWEAKGTHQGALMQIPPTGRAVAFQGMSFLTVRDRHVLRGTYLFDLAGLLKALGVL